MDSKNGLAPIKEENIGNNRVGTAYSQLTDAQSELLDEADPMA